LQGVINLSQKNVSQHIFFNAKLCANLCIN
jgi:hypothetical protein